MRVIGEWIVLGRIPDIILDIHMDSIATYQDDFYSTSQVDVAIIVWFLDIQAASLLQTWIRSIL